jgi:hypothetical protein
MQLSEILTAFWFEKRLRFFGSKINRIYYSLKKKLSVKFTNLLSIFLCCWVFSYLLPVAAYGVRVPPLPHLVCCVSTVHCRPAGNSFVVVCVFCCFVGRTGVCYWCWWRTDHHSWKKFEPELHKNSSEEMKEGK